MTDYYKSGKIYAEGYSTENRYLKETGEFHYYYENGNKKEVIKYEKSIPLGSYFSWYENGNKQIEGEYLQSEKDDRRPGALKINQLWNEQNIQKITNGDGYFDLTTEKGCDEGKILNGLKDSIWCGSDSKINYTYIEKYSTGKLSAGISVDKDGVKRIYHDEETKPEYPGGVEEFYKFIGKNFKVPQIEGLSGKVFLAFIIEKNGEVDNIKIIKSMGNEVDQEAYRVLSESPAWKPGKLRGIPVRVLYSIPIDIQSNR